MEKKSSNSTERNDEPSYIDIKNLYKVLETTYLSCILRNSRNVTLHSTLT